MEKYQIWSSIPLAAFAFAFLSQSVSADDVVVLSKDVDVLVEFYAPWCGNCKSLAPIYEKVAATFKMEEDAVIANLDAGKYRDLAEKYEVSGFPTLKFFPKGNKADEDYGGGRDLDEFVAFINEKSRTSRDSKGQLTSEAGKVEHLDLLVKEFVATNDEENKAVFAQVEEEVGKLNGSASRYGKIYLKAARNYLENGSGYAKKEIQCLEHILENSISPAKGK